MNKLLSTSLGAVLIALVSNSYAATVSYDEAVDGDLSSNPNTPTIIPAVITDSLIVTGSEEFHNAYNQIGDNFMFSIGTGLQLQGSATGSIAVQSPILEADWTFKIGRAPFDTVFSLELSSSSAPVWKEWITVPGGGYRGGDGIEQNIITAPVFTEGDWFVVSSSYSLQYDFELPCETIGNARVCGFAEVNYELAFNVAPVPIPAAVWLLGSALFGLCFTARRKQLVA